VIQPVEITLQGTTAQPSRERVNGAAIEGGRRRPRRLPGRSL